VARLRDSTWAKLTAFNRRWYAEAAKAGVRGVRMGIARVTEKNARFWGVPVTRVRREVFQASTRDGATFRRDVARISTAFEGGRTVRLHHSNGTDPILEPAGRSALWGIGTTPPESMLPRLGRMASIPDANVYVAADETFVEGRLVANRTTSTFAEPLKGGRFTFREGRLKGFSFSKGGPTFREPFRAGGAGKDHRRSSKWGPTPARDSLPGSRRARGAL
jgi:leucyl aminopeptidase (aminopeptidase T)